MGNPMRPLWLRFYDWSATDLQAAEVNGRKL
jgi:hypothetical protein